MISDEEKLDDYLEKIDKMMRYLKIHAYVITTYNLDLPIEAKGSRYRGERIFRYYKATRSITYNGWDSDRSSVSNKLNEIEINGIEPNLSLSTRIYDFLRNECLNRIHELTNKKKIKNIKNLFLLFNNLEFLKEDGEQNA